MSCPYRAPASGRAGDSENKGAGTTGRTHYKNAAPESQRLNICQTPPPREARNLGPMTGMIRPYRATDELHRYG